MTNTTAYSSPFAHTGSTVSSVMLNVCLAMVPCTFFGLYLFGWPAIFLFSVTCITALVSELFCLFLLKQPWYRVLDGSALLTGWLIAITLPPWAPWWVGVIGSFFAITIGKQLYGGIGQNIFNPAMLARTALLITFPVQMTSWVSPAPLGSELAPDFFEALRITFMSMPAPDGLTGATALGHLKTSLTLNMNATDVLQSDFNLWNAFSGYSSGSMGETSELLILLGAAYLLWRRIISWEIPAAFMFSIGMLAFIFHLVDNAGYGNMVFHMTSGGVLLGAFFIATDPITSPISRIAKLIFGAGCGTVVYIIRTWGGFPEAVAFSVLFMNGFTPLIDRYCRPRIYGRLPGGKPIPQLSAVELTREVERKK